MKNFLDLLATKQAIRISLRLRPVHDNGYPGMSLRINQEVTEYLQLQYPIEHVVELPLLDTIDIEITMFNKQYAPDKETAVIIDSINIDGLEIIPGWTHLAQYHSERGQQGPTSYLGINGSWNLKIDEPFYHWRHRVTGQGWLLKPI